MPVISEVHDRNGDGIGDSLVVGFNKSFKEDGKIVDSLLLVLLEVTWEKGVTVSFHHKDYSPDSLKKKDFVMRLYKTPGFFAKNREYWENFLKGDTLIVIAEPNTQLSENITTSGFNSGKGNISSFTPFFDQEQCPPGRPCPDAAFQYSSEGNKTAVFDKMPPIVVKAEYEYSKSNEANCEEKTSGCSEKLTVYLSEPVFAGTQASALLIQNPFSYCFGRSQQTACPTSDIDSAYRFSQTWDNNNKPVEWPWEEPRPDDYSKSVIYNPNTKTLNTMAQLESAKGDSIVVLTYAARKTATGTTRMPKSDDWVKIRPKIFGDVFADAEGNAAHLRERGVLIRGTNPSRKKQVKIAVVRPGDPVLGGIFETGPKPPWWSPNANGQGLFADTSVSELLPVPKDKSHPDTVKANYPGSVGTIFDIADRIRNDVNTFFAEECGVNGLGCKTRENQPLTKDNIAYAITVRANAYYHTNLGDYTAHRKNIAVPCTDPIFQNKDGKGNCYTNEYNFYLAWDLKANTGRYVGTGAYVAISKFHLQLDYKDKEGNDRSKKLAEDEFIDMFGVRRGK